MINKKPAVTKKVVNKKPATAPKKAEEKVEPISFSRRVWPD